MVDLKDISVDASRDTSLAKQIFAREGILVVRNLFPQHVTDAAATFLRDALVEVDEALGRYGISLDETSAPERLMALMECARTELTDGERHTFLGHFPLDVRLGEPLREIPRFLNAHPLLFDLLGTRRLYAHMPPAARYVLPRYTLARVPLHQDISYNRHMDDFCVVWVPLVPIDGACGGMAAYARTHNAREMVDRCQRAAAGWLPAIETDTETIGDRVELAPLGIGDVVIMGKRTMHESMPNMSDRVRLSCDFRFFGERSQSTKHYLDISANSVIAPAAQ